MESEVQGPRKLLYTPDVVLCDACRAELNNPEDRRHGYAFITCTQCGPRYSIITDLPYDRPLTTMAGFAMCPTCGIPLRLYDAQQTYLEGIAATPFINEGVRRWQAGQIIALKGIGGYLLTCDAC